MKWCKGVFSERDNYSYPDPGGPCPEVTIICSPFLNTWWRPFSVEAPALDSKLCLLVGVEGAQRRYISKLSFCISERNTCDRQKQAREVETEIRAAEGMLEHSTEGRSTRCYLWGNNLPDREKARSSTSGMLWGQGFKYIFTICIYKTLINYQPQPGTLLNTLYMLTLLILATSPGTLIIPLQTQREAQKS